MKTTHNFILIKLFASLTIAGAVLICSCNESLKTKSPVADNVDTTQKALLAPASNTDEHFHSIHQRKGFKLIKNFIRNYSSFAQNHGFAVDIPVGDLSPDFTAPLTNEPDADDHIGLLIFLCDSNNQLFITYRKDTIQYRRSSVNFNPVIHYSSRSIVFNYADSDTTMYLKSSQSPTQKIFSPKKYSNDAFKSNFQSVETYPWAFFHYQQIQNIIKQDRPSFIRVFLGYEEDIGRRNQLHLVLMGVDANGKVILPGDISLPPTSSSAKLVLDKAWP